ncbi:MAG: hypothetical protein U5J98_02505 [Halobacteriales archaeon]|nr:hypothetical protein [Halobacteriales archaeon]
MKADYDESLIYENARQAVELGIQHGVLHHRAFADVDTAAGLEGVKALLRLRDDYADVVDLRRRRVPPGRPAPGPRRRVARRGGDGAGCRRGRRHHRGSFTTPTPASTSTAWSTSPSSEPTA